MAGADQLRVHPPGLVQHGGVDGGFGDRLAARDVAGAEGVLVLQGHALEADRRPVEQEARPLRIDGHAPQPDGFVERVLGPAVRRQDDHVQGVQRRDLRRPGRGVADQEAAVHHCDRTRVQRSRVEGVADDGLGVRRHQRAGVGIEQAGRVEQRGQDLDPHLAMIGAPPRVVEHHVDVDAVQVRDHVGADRVQRAVGLEEYRLQDAAVVPPVGQPPGHDVVADAQRRIVDTHGQHVGLARAQRPGRVEGEGRRAALVVAEVGPVEPDVGHVVDRAEVQGEGQAGPVRRDGEAAPVPAAPGLGALRRARRSRQGLGGPAAVVEAGILAAAGRLYDPAQRTGAIGEGQVGVELPLVHPPGAAQVQPQPRLGVEGGHRQAVLEADPGPGHLLQAQGRPQGGDGAGWSAGGGQEGKQQEGRTQAGQGSSAHDPIVACAWMTSGRSGRYDR